MASHLLLSILVVSAFGLSPPVVSPTQALLLVRLALGLYTTHTKYLEPITMLLCCLYTIAARIAHSTNDSEKSPGIIRAAALAFGVSDVANIAATAAHKHPVAPGTVLASAATFVAVVFTIKAVRNLRF